MSEAISRMLEEDPELAREYERWLAAIGNHDPYTGPNCLGIKEVLRAHFLIAKKFRAEGVGMGGIGPKSLDLLHSALSRQHVSFDGKSKWTDKFDLCATLLYGLAKDHAFHDANKRTAFLCALFQMQKAGWCVTAPEREFEDLIVLVADDGLDRFSRYNSMVADGEPDAEVKFISFFFRKNMRQIDNRTPSITFHELQTILARYGCKLANPRDNHIDVVRVERRKRFIVFGPEIEEEKKLRQIGFPRWTAEVGKSALKTVREVTGLTYKKGVDSASFYQGIDPMQELITSYHEPLQRLAER